MDRAALIRTSLAEKIIPLASYAQFLGNAQQEQLAAVYEEIELPVIAPTLAMTLVGLPVNQSVLMGIQESCAVQMEIARRVIRADVGSYFNPDDAAAVRRLALQRPGPAVPARDPSRQPGGV